jgi:hypothetical protein
MILDPTIAAIIVAGVTLAFNLSIHMFGGGWRLSSRLTSLENSIEAIQTEIKKLSDVLIKMADIRGELKVIDTRLTSCEQDVRELRHGDGFIRGARGIDREFP